MPLVSASAAAEMASGVLATRSGRHTRAMPGTSRTRSATRAAACAQPLLAAPLAVGDPQHDHAVAVMQVDRHAEVPHGGADVGVQDLLELRPVPPFEHDLAQLEQHARLIAARRAHGGEELWHPHSLPAGGESLGLARAGNRVLAPVRPAGSADSLSA